jgi:hypothetical protein
LKLRSADNVVWTGILTKTEPKLVFYAQRLNTDFDCKVKAVVAKGKQPNLKNSSFMYRDENPELVMRAAFLMVHFDADLRQLFSKKEHDQLQLEFLRGARDSDLLSCCKVMEKDFKLMDLRFVQLACCAETMPSLSDETHLDQAQLVSLQADFNLFWETLKFEQQASFDCTPHHACYS